MSAQPAKSRLGLKIGIALAVLVAAGVVALYAFRPTAVVAPVERGTAAHVVTGSVVVHAQKDIQQVKSELGGRVTWIDPRQLGEPFKAGEPMVKLDSSDLERQRKLAADNYQTYIERRKIEKQNDPTLLRAKEALAVAKVRFDRGEISPIDWSNAQRELAAVETKLALEDFDAKQLTIKFENDQAELQRQIDKMTIRAPMDGMLQGVMVAENALIAPGTTVATFFSNVRDVIAKVGEEDIGHVRLGHPAKVRLLNLGDQTFEAKVSAILPFADADTQRYGVYLDVQAKPEQLLPFSTGEATITVAERQNQPLIPRRALFNENNVFVVNGGVVQRREVTLGFRGLNFAEVTSNLKEGEFVIVEDIDQFRDGQRVRTVSAK